MGMFAVTDSDERMPTITKGKGTAEGREGKALSLSTRRFFGRWRVRLQEV
jgi:hypothetical protein